jgi:hypothetical protein
MIVALILINLQFLLFVFLTKRIYTVTFFGLLLFFQSVYTFVGLHYFDYLDSTPFDLISFNSIEHLHIAIRNMLLLALQAFVVSLLIPVKQAARFVIQWRKSNIYFWPPLMVPIILIGIVGLDQFFYRETYSIGNEGLFKIFLFFYIPIATLLITRIASFGYKSLAFAILYFTLLSLSSRFVLLVPFFYLVFSFLIDPKVTISALVFNLVLLVVSLALVMQLRHAGEQGFVPNLLYFFTEGPDLNYLFIGFNYIFSYSVGLYASMLDLNFYPVDLFIDSISPLPGRVVEISRISYELKINAISPYSAIGAIFIVLNNYSFIFSLLFFVGISLTERFVSTRGVVLPHLVRVLYLFGFLLATQYNLRGFSRIIYLTLFIIFVHWIAHHAKKYFVYCALRSKARTGKSVKARA